MYRWHDLNLGFSMERGNLEYDDKRKPYKATTERGKYRCIHEGRIIL